MLAQQVDGRQPRLAQEIERTGQQHRGGVRLRHGFDARLVHVFEMIRGQRAKRGGHRGALHVRELLGVEFHAQALEVRGVEDALGLFERKADVFAESIDRIDQTFLDQRRQHVRRRFR